VTCPVCKAPSVGTKPCPGYCEGVEDGREEMVRAFWASVCERHATECDELADSHDRHASYLDARGQRWAAERRQRLSSTCGAEALQLRHWAKRGV